MVIVALVSLVFSLILIWKGSDWITDSLIPVAKRIGTSYIAVTTLLVSFMLSVPEIFAAVYSYTLGHINIGLGVIIGSVMANIGLTVGLSATIKPLDVEKSVVVRDGLFLVLAATVVLLFGSDLKYVRSEGGVLLLLFAFYALNVWYFEKHKAHKHRKLKLKKMQQNLRLIGGLTRFKLKASLLTFFLGALMLVGGSYLFSFALIRVSEFIPIPDLLLGLTLGALGPALPNIAAAIQGTRKGLKDAAITETFGSNIFTLLITLGVIILIAPFGISGSVFYFDLSWMIVLNLFMVALIFKGYRYKEPALTRYEGVILILFYLALILVHVWMF
jgi:cation:H+ antiporter